MNSLWQTGRRFAAGCFVAALLALVAPLASACAQVRTGDAETALRAGRYEEAIELFTDWTRREPNSAAALRGLARTLIQTGRFAEAEAAVRAAIARVPAGELGNVLGEALYQQGRIAEAEAAFRTASASAADQLTAELNLAILYYERGEHDEAMRRFDRFIDHYNTGPRLDSHDLTAVGIAVRYLGENDPQLFRDALRALDEAAAAAPNDAEPRILVGELFLEKYNSGDARASFREALNLNPSHPRALLGMAKLLSFDGQPDGLELAEQSLEINPGFVAARVFLARQRLLGEDFAGAEAEAEAALQVNPAATDALAVLAAARYVSGDLAGFQLARDSALALNPRFANVFTVTAEMCVQQRRYHEAVDFTRKAIELQPRAWHAHGLLGVNLLRIGRMEQGRQSLETAFRGDPYNIWFKNTLDLLDTFADYRETDSPHFVIALEGEEAELLGPMVANVAEEAYHRMAELYDHRPPTPIRIELLPSQADFSVRTVGLTGLNALGASFGPVVAMTSPTAQRDGTSNWGVVLWHELAHSFHLSLSNHRVPRWFTEGLAVLEQRRARPDWNSAIAPELLLAAAAGRLFPVLELSDGFSQPESPAMLLAAYEQAAQICQFIERRHGFATIRAMLVGYRDGSSTEELFRTVLDTEPDAFDRAFEEDLRSRYGSVIAALRVAPDPPLRLIMAPSREALDYRAASDPNDFLAQLALGRALFLEDRPDEARAHLQRARRLYPDYAGEDNPYWYLARIYQQSGDLPAAAAALAEITRRSDRDLAANLLEADLLEELGDEAGAAAALERAVYIFPSDRELHTRLAELHSRTGRPADAARARQAIVALQPVDMADAYYQLALAQLAAGDSAAARRSVLFALERAPNFAEAQELLLRLRGREPRQDAGPPSPPNPLTSRPRRRSRRPPAGRVHLWRAAPPFSQAGRASRHRSGATSPIPRESMA